jgi:hypothetical protein
MKNSLTAAIFTILLPLVLSTSTPADEPTAIPFEVVFDDVNPCTGKVHTVTIVGTSFVHSHDGRTIVHSDRTISTNPTGFTGHGTDSSVANGNIVMFRLTDILTSPSGDRIRARFVFVLDLSTGAVTVEKGEVTCLGK